MIYLPIKEASKYIKRETGIKFSDYELARAGCRGYFDFYLDGAWLAKKGYVYAISTGWIGQILDDVVLPSIDKSSSNETTFLDIDISGILNKKAFLFTDEYIKIDNPSYGYREKSVVYFQDCIHPYGLASASSIAKRILSVDKENSPLPSIYKELTAFCEWITEEVKTTSNLGCEILKLDNRDYSNFDDDMGCFFIKLAPLYISIEDIKRLVNIITSGTSDYLNSQPNNPRMKVTELWDLGSDTDSKDLFIELAEKRAKLGYLTIDDLKKIRPPRTADNATKQAVRRWKNKAIEYISNKEKNSE